jgi:hypothetical protein
MHRLNLYTLRRFFCTPVLKKNHHFSELEIRQLLA